MVEPPKAALSSKGPKGIEGLPVKLVTPERDCGAPEERRR